MTTSFSQCIQSFFKILGSKKSLVVDVTNLIGICWIICGQNMFLELWFCHGQKG
jgi:hypothetical protein